MNDKKMNYFHELRQQILDESKWDKNKFVVFNNEAGTGKSQSAFRFIGEMTKHKVHKILYVQRFVKDENLNKTVDTINEYAGKRVAEGVYSKEKETVVRKKAKAQVLCIAHQMYKQICLGNRKELIHNRNLLIIDEYPDFLVEKISVTLEDIGYLWARNIGNRFLDILANMLREKYHDCEVRQERNKDKKMLYLTFNEKEFEVYKEKLTPMTNSTNNAKETAILSKINQIIENGCLFYEHAFNTFNNQLAFKMLDGNILLDANSGFDSKYSLSSLFKVKYQEKFYNYATSLIRHIEINTGKKELKTQINLVENVFKRIPLETKQRILIVTDKDNAETMEEKIYNHFHALGYNSDEIAKIIKERIAIDYFGNIIGVNSYRYFDTVVILKTPYYDYLSYALTYFYFCSLNGEEMEDIEVFRNEKVEEIRKTTVAGEVYQAIKRINRDNSQSAEMVVCTDYQEAMDIVQQQLPNIRYEKDDSLSINKLKNTMKKESVFDKRVAEVKRILIDMRETGVKEIKKKEIRDLIEVSDKSNFSKILKALHVFIIENDFVIEGQRITLNK